jgi:hypothetical protein
MKENKNTTTYVPQLFFFVHTRPQTGTPLANRTETAYFYRKFK